MHSTSTVLLVVVVTLICANLPSPVEPTTTMKTASHGSGNNLTESVINSNINSTNVIRGGNTNRASRNKRTNNHNRIIGGKIARLGQFPSLVSIYKADFYICCGTLLQADWVLTALHCIRNLSDPTNVKIDPSLLTAFAGHTNLKKVEFSAQHIRPGINPEMIEVYETYLYEHYVSLQDGGDIGLMRLKSKFTLGPNIQLARLDPNGINSGEKVLNCTAVGWGRTQEYETSLSSKRAPNLMNTRFGTESMELRYVYMLTILTDSCNTHYVSLINREKHKKKINWTHLCARATTPEGPCYGDSGGPLICGGYQMGLLSYGYNCASNPDVYTRIVAYKKWIDKTIALHNREAVTTPRWYHRKTAIPRMKVKPRMRAIPRMRSMPRDDDDVASSSRICQTASVLGTIIVMVIRFNVLC